MRHRIYALICAIIFLCSPLFGQAPAGYISVSQSHLTDSNGNPANNLSVCAQAMSGNQPISIRVGSGSGVTTTQQVCGTVTNGVWSMNLPDVSQSSPLNATFSMTAIDNLTGENLLAGYSHVQPHSQTCTVVSGVVSCAANGVGDWCSSSSCDLDNLDPNAPSLALIVQGQKGEKGDTGCNLDSTSCVGVVLQTPPGTQTLTQPSASNLNINTSGGGRLLYNGGEPAVLNSSGTQLFSSPLNIFQAMAYRYFAVHGDSFTGTNDDGHCYGASSRQNCQWYKLGTALGIPESDWNIVGQGGTTFAAQAQYVYNENVTADGYQLFYHHTGINDCNILGCPSSYSNRANGPGMFRSGMTALGIWYLTPESQKLRAANVCTGSGWSADTATGYGMGAIASATGTTCTFTTYANSIISVAFAASTVDGGTFTIDVDGGATGGGATGTFSTQMPVDNVGRPIPPYGTMTYAPQIAQVPVTFAGVHTVTITVTSSPTITFTGNTTAGSTYATGITDKRWVQGQSITGPGIPSGTTIYQTIEEGVPAGSMPLSQAATATATGVTFTVSGATVRPTFFSGNASILTAGGPTLLLTGMPANGHTPFCIADNYADQPSDAYNESIRTVVANLRGWGYDARFVDERASQNGSTTTFTAITTNGSTTVTVSSTAGLHVGDAVFASPGMPLGGVIASIGSGTITLSSPATASGTNPSGVSHWFFANNDCIHPSDEGYATLGSLAINAASGLTDNTLRSSAPPSNTGATCTQFPCVVTEYHASNQTGSINSFTLLNIAGVGTYRFCANLAVTNFSSTDVTFIPQIAYLGKYNNGDIGQVFLSLPGTPLQTVGGHYLGYDTARTANNTVPTFVDETTNALYRQGSAPFASFLTTGTNCVTYTAKDGTPMYMGVGVSGTNTGGSYAVDATLEQLTKQ